MSLVAGLLYARLGGGELLAKRSDLRVLLGLVVGRLVRCLGRWVGGSVGWWAGGETIIGWGADEPIVG